MEVFNQDFSMMSKLLDIKLLHINYEHQTPLNHHNVQHQDSLIKTLNYLSREHKEDYYT